jgi:NAD(P)-dependent dehydrogenase (short-subunit alcohol dehydrogenase family)
MGDGRQVGKVAVVTGASRGLGAGLAVAFGQAGMRLGICARSLPVVPVGAEAVARSVDVADPVAVDAFAGDVIKRFGRIDLWVNNAGVVAPIGPLADADPVALRRQIETNVLGALHGTATFARHVRGRAGEGVLVNISSGAATKPYEGWASYGASKAAVEMATEVVAREEWGAGLRACALSPGVVDTDMQALIRSTSPELFPSVRRFRRLHDEGSFNSPGWVARFILDRLVDLPAGTGHGADAWTVRVRVPDEPGSG